MENTKMTYTSIGVDTDIDHGKIIKYTLCDNCGMYVSECSNPDCQKEFQKEDGIYCSYNGMHYCEDEVAINYGDYYPSLKE